MNHKQKEPSWESHWDWLESYQREVLKTIKDLSNQVSTARKQYSWYLYLSWREISEQQFLGLSALMNFMEENIEKSKIELDEIEMSIWIELRTQFTQSSTRFKNSRKGNIWSSIVRSGICVSTQYLIDNQILLPIDEFRGNILKNFLSNWIPRHYTLRFNTPRRLKKQGFVRGYRDHGSTSSESERARREANTTKIPGITQEGYIVDYEALQNYQERMRQIKDENSS